MPYIVVTVAAALASLPTATAMDHVSQRPDGSPIYWTLDQQTGRAKQGLLVLAQGSGCQAATANSNIVKAKAMLPDFAVLTVEKPGVPPHSAPKDMYSGCSHNFYAHHTVTQRAIDYAQIIKSVEAEPWWNGQLVLFGGSEGAAAISKLAPIINPSAVVLFSTAPGNNYARSFKEGLPPDAAAEADRVFAEVRANPMSAKQWGGNSYVWYADLFRLNLIADLLRVSAPVLLVQGAADTNAPVQAARTFKDEYARAGHCNLTYWEVPGYDHQMHDAAGVSHLDEVLKKISVWIREALAKQTAKVTC